MTNFAKWLDTFIAEKGINLDMAIFVEGPSGENMMSLAIVADAIKSAPTNEQAAIKNMFVKIDFSNADPIGYFKHLARAIAI